MGSRKGKTDKKKVDKTDKKKAGTKKIWEHKNPKKRRKSLTDKQRAKAKRRASKHGRSKPSLVDNINAAK